MQQALKVILVDDHAVVRAGLRMLLLTELSIHVIAEAERGEQAYQLFIEHQPDVIVMDLSMPGIGGLESIRRLCSRAPTAKILVFSVHEELVYINRAMQAGAKGYVSKHGHPATLIDAIQKIADGETYIEASLTKPSATVDVNGYQALIDNLSSREFDIFLLLAKGLTIHMISEQLCLGYKTVANYGTQIRNKLAVSTVAELAHIAVVLGLFDQIRE